MIGLLTSLRYTLHPSRSAKKYSRYDSAGFDRWHDACRDVAGPAPATDNSIEASLDNRGFAIVDTLSEAEAGEILKLVYTQSIIRRKGGAVEWAEDFRIDDPAVATHVLGSILRPPIAAALRGYFGSEFMVYWWLASRTLTRTRSTRSMLWHCDSGPTRHLKVLVYLEDTNESGGGTEFLDRPATDRLHEVGYTFGPVSRRSRNIVPLIRELKMARRPVKPELRAGQAVIFEPVRVLHREVVPTRRHRHIITLCLVPSPVNWRVAMDRVDFPGRSLAMEWPQSVLEFAQMLAPICPMGFALPAVAMHK